MPGGGLDYNLIGGIQFLVIKVDLFFVVVSS